jgi:hypothetical protein
MAVDTWATVPGMYCYAARSILAITPRSNTNNLINALQRTNIKNNAIHFLFDCEASVPVPNAASVPAQVGCQLKWHRNHGFCRVAEVQETT